MKYNTSSKETNLIDLCSDAIIKHQNKELINLISSSENINEKNKNGHGLYFVAALNDNIQALKILQERKAIFHKDINIAGATNISILLFLKDCNLLDVEYKNDDGRNSLQQACFIASNTDLSSDNNYELKINKCVHFLIQEGADVNNVDVYGQNSLMNVAKNTLFQLSNKLIHSGINVEHISNEGLLFTDYSFNDFYNHYYLTSFNTYSNMLKIYKKIKTSNNKSENISVLLHNLYIILDLNNENKKESEIRHQNAAFHDACLYLQLKPAGFKTSLLNEIYDKIQKKSLLESDISEYNHDINKYNKIINNLVFLSDQEYILKKLI